MRRRNIISLRAGCRAVSGLASGITTLLLRMLSVLPLQHVRHHVVLEVSQERDFLLQLLQLQLGRWVHERRRTPSCLAALDTSSQQ